MTQEQPAAATASAICGELLTHVEVPAGPLTFEDMLPSMQVRIQMPAGSRVVSGTVSDVTLHGVTIHASTGGSTSLVETASAPLSSWDITLLKDVDARLVLPGTCARGAALRASWEGLWLADNSGRWEPVRDFDGRLLQAELSTLAPVSLDRQELDAPLEAGDLALVEVEGRQLRGIRWAHAWRLPAVGYTASRVPVQPLARLRAS